MEHPFLLSLMFGMGIIAQAILLIKHKGNSTRLIIESVFISLIFLGVVYLKYKEFREAGLYLQCFIYFLMFTASFAFRAIKDILPVIDERFVLIFTVTFWYVFLSYFPSTSKYKTIVAIIALVPTTASVIIAFLNVQLNISGKLFLYSWFLIINIYFALFQFSFGNISFFFNPDKVNSLTVIDAIITGATFLYIMTYTWYIVGLILLLVPSWNEPYTETLKEWEEHAKTLADSYSNYKLEVIYTSLIILIQGGLLALNYYTKLIPDFLIINISISFIPQLVFAYLNKQKSTIAI